MGKMHSVVTPYRTQNITSNHGNRQHKTLWYQFCNFKHFLKAENGEDSLANLCEELGIGIHVTQYETGVLLDLPSDQSVQCYQNFTGT